MAQSSLSEDGFREQKMNFGILGSGSSVRHALYHFHDDFNFWPNVHQVRWQSKFQPFQILSESVVGPEFARKRFLKRTPAAPLTHLKTVQNTTTRCSTGCVGQRVIFINFCTDNQKKNTTLSG